MRPHPQRRRSSGDHRLQSPHDAHANLDDLDAFNCRCAGPADIGHDDVGAARGVATDLHQVRGRAVAAKDSVYMYRAARARVVAADIQCPPSAPMAQI